MDSYNKFISESSHYHFDMYSKAWGNLTNEQMEEYILYFRKHFDEFDNDSAYMHDKDFYVFIPYYIGDKLVALCDFAWLKYENHENVHINYIYTDVKRAGIAESMIKFIIDTYDDEADTFSCYVRKNNIPSLSLFTKLGFKLNNDGEQIKDFYYLVKET